MDSLVADKYRQQMLKHSDASMKTDDELSKSERTRGEILTAAARLFRHEGYYATTMRDIAQESGIEAGSIYYHFGSKDQILSEVLDIGVRALHTTVCEIIQAAKDDSKGFRETFAQLIETHLTYLLTTSDFTSANIRNYPMLSEEARAPHRDLRASYARAWSGFLNDAKSANLLRRDISVSTIRQFVLSAMNWTVEWYDVDRYPVHVLAGRMSNLILDGMCSHQNSDSGVRQMNGDIAFKAPEMCANSVGRGARAEGKRLQGDDAAADRGRSGYESGERLLPFQIQRRNCGRGSKRRTKRFIVGCQRRSRSV